MTSYLRTALAGLAFAAAATAGAAAQAETVEVEMLSNADGQVMVFKPAVVHVEPGDTVRFVATDPGHNAQSMPEMTPEGGKSFEVPFNETKEVTFETEGVHGYICNPHHAMGMVGLTVVGDPSANLEQARQAAKKAPGRAKQRFADYFAQVDAQ